MEPIRSLFKRRELLWQFLLRNVKVRHRGSLLGALWLIINPLLMLCLYVFAFGVVFGGGSLILRMNPLWILLSESSWV